MEPKYIRQDKGFYVISDLHFSHKNIIKYCNRPFSSANEMNRVLFENWNKVVKPEDDIFFLGDFMMGGSTYKEKHFNNVYNSLNGNKTFIQGNHDSPSEHFVKENMVIIEYDNKEIILTHRPLPNWELISEDNSTPSFHLFGHIHQKQINVKNSYNCSVEVNDYKPIHIDEILKNNFEI